MSDIDPIEIDEQIEAPPGEVFEYFADPERRPFGRDGYLEVGEELHREEPARIAWRVTTSDGESRREGAVEIEVSPSGTGSHVRVTHRVGRKLSVGPRAELALAT